MLSGNTATMRPKERDDAQSPVPSGVRRLKRKTPSRSKPYGYDALQISAARELELDMALPDRNVLNDHDTVRHALETVDRLSKFAKHPDCAAVRQTAIYHIKNRMLYLLWHHRRDIFRGVWQHSSRINDQICWRCNGHGIKGGTLESCPKCGGSGRWKKGDCNVLSVFAIESGSYATTWHFPTSVAKNVLQESIVHGDDLVTVGLWTSEDSRKAPVGIADGEYEEFRSFLAWFVRKSETQTGAAKR